MPALTTALIVLPLVGALSSSGCCRCPGRAAGALALLVALAEVALWAVGRRRLRLRRRACSSQDRQSWFSDLGVSYHVGFYGFSLWLAGLTVVVGAAAIGYALVGRPRARRAPTTGCCSS